VCDHFKHLKAFSQALGNNNFIKLGSETHCWTWLLLENLLLFICEEDNLSIIGMIVCFHSILSIYTAGMNAQPWAIHIWPFERMGLLLGKQGWMIKQILECMKCVLQSNLGQCEIMPRCDLELICDFRIN
jgi:hypothetical protein